MTAKCSVLYNFVHLLTAKLGVLTSETNWNDLHIWNMFWKSLPVVCLKEIAFLYYFKVERFFYLEYSTFEIYFL